MRKSVSSQATKSQIYDSHQFERPLSQIKYTFEQVSLPPQSLTPIALTIQGSHESTVTGFSDIPPLWQILKSFYPNNLEPSLANF